MYTGEIIVVLLQSAFSPELSPTLFEHSGAELKQNLM